MISRKMNTHPDNTKQQKEHAKRPNAVGREK